MSSKVHVKALRSPYWLNSDIMSSTSKNYSSLWLRNLYLKMWLNRHQLTGVKIHKKSLNSKLKTKNVVKQGPTSIKTNFHGTSVSSWYQSSFKPMKSNTHSK